MITREWPLVPVYATAGAFLMVAGLGEPRTAWHAALSFVWLFATITWAARWCATRRRSPRSSASRSAR